MKFIVFVLTFIAPGAGQAYKGRWERAWSVLACAFFLPVLVGLFWGRILIFFGLKVPAVSYGGPPWQIMVPIYLSWVIALAAAVDAVRLPAPAAGAPSALKLAAFFLFASLLVNLGPALLVYSLQAFTRA